MDHVGDAARIVNKVDDVGDAARAAGKVDDVSDAQKAAEFGASWPVSSEKARATLGWNPERRFAETMAELLSQR